MKKKIEQLTDKELLEQTFIFKKLCNLVPTKKEDVDALNALYKECVKRKLTKQGDNNE